MKIEIRRRLMLVVQIGGKLYRHSVDIAQRTGEAPGFAVYDPESERLLAFENTEDGAVWASLEVFFPDEVAAEAAADRLF